MDDIPSPKDCLYGAFFYSSKPLARIKSLDIRPALASQKIITVISTNDIPKEGTNIGSASIFGSEPLFADSLAEYAGQPLGMVVCLSLPLQFLVLYFILPWQYLFLPSVLFKLVKLVCFVHFY